MEIGTRVRHRLDLELGTVTAYNESYTSPVPLVQMVLPHESNTPHVQVEWDDGTDDWVENIGDHVWYPVKDLEVVE